MKICEDSINNTTLQKLLIDNHKVRANKGKVFGQILSEHFFGFCNAFKNVTKVLRFHITLKTNNLQDVVCSTLPQAAMINVTFDSLHLFVPNFVRSPETQVDFNQSIETILPNHLILGLPIER